MRLLSRTIALAGALALVAAPAAMADPTEAEREATDMVLRDYADGDIDACKYTVEELELALGGVTPDLRQYASDFPAAVRDAISAHAGGLCDEEAATPTPVPTTPADPGAGTSPGGSGGAAEFNAPATTDGSGSRTFVPDPPGPAAVASTQQPAGPDPGLDSAAAASPGNDAPIPLIGLGVLSSLALLTVALLSALRRLGEAGGPLAPAYHSWREAQWRAGGVWQDFRDWLQVGR